MATSNVGPGVGSSGNGGPWDRRIVVQFASGRRPATEFGPHELSTSWRLHDRLQQLDIDEVGAEPAVPPAELGEAAAEVLDNCTYGRLSEALREEPDHYSAYSVREQRSPEPIWFGKNEEFWSLVRDLEWRAGCPVVLDRFCLMEWLPFSPGLYHTDLATSARREATNHVTRLDRGGRPAEFAPVGKGLMVEGGLGSLRLAPREIDGALTFFLCATSSGVSYHGIPVVFRSHSSDYDRIAGKLRRKGSVWGRIFGELRILPREPRTVTYPARMPRLFVLASRVEEVNEQLPALACAQLIFGRAYGGGPKGSCYAHFEPGGNDNDLHRALDWMNTYIRSHTAGRRQPVIFADFDERYDHYDEVEFPLRRISRGWFDHALMHKYMSFAKVNVRRLNVYGSLTSVGDGSTVIVDSTVTSSFNTVSRIDAGAEALRLLAKHIAASGKSEATELYAEMSAEFGRDSPRRSVLRALWNGIKEILPSAATVAGIAEAIDRIAS